MKMLINIIGIIARNELMLVIVTLTAFTLFAVIMNLFN